MTGLLTVLEFWQTLLFGDPWSIMQSVLNVNILQLSGPLKAMSLLKGRRRKENCSFASTACTKEKTLAPVGFKAPCAVIWSDGDRGDIKKTGSN